MDFKATILVVDDEEYNRELLRGLIEFEDYEVLEAANGKQAIEVAQRENIDVIIMDVMMPIMDGFQATEKLKSMEETKNIPIIIATTLDSRKEMLNGIAKGADDYLTKPIDLEELQLRLNNNIIKKRYFDLVANQNKILNERVQKQTEEIRSSFIETTHRLTLAAEFKDPDTGEHIRRISHYCRILAKEMKMDQLFIDQIFHAAAMHDIGKVGIPDSVLLKKGPLDEEEWRVMKRHPGIGANILKESRSKLLNVAENIALYHHERWDGNGYPNSLKGDEIPMEARIMNICDQYDALRSARPYKPALSHERTMEILLNGDGRSDPSHFDPDVLAAFERVAERFKEIFEMLAEERTDQW